MPAVESPASASPSQLAGMNPPSPQGGDDSSGRIPGSGSADPSNVGQAVSSANAKVNNDVKALRMMEAQLTEFSQSYPTASKALRSAAESIRAAQRQVQSDSGLQEPPVPNTTA